MPESKRRKRKSTTSRPKRPRTAKPDDFPPVDGLVRTILRGGQELLTVEDPLEAEQWASSVLGVTYKPSLPLDVQDRFEDLLWRGVVSEAEASGGAASLAVLRALEAVGPDTLASAASDAARRVARTGVPEPPWAHELGTAEFLRAWTFGDPFGDQVGYFAHFRYPGRPEHGVTAIYDENLGGIIKDASAGILAGDPRTKAEEDPEVVVGDVDPAVLAARVSGGIASGDLYIDNDWTPDFKEHRALLLTRMRLLPRVEVSEDSPPDETAREALIAEFLASAGAPEDAEVTRLILGLCLTARCDYGDGDPLRWSPTVVEMFLLDFLPRKVTLDSREIRAIPDVLRRWVHFALARRGLEERWIAETIEAVDALTPEFRRAVTDPTSSGPAKALANAMLADGVDISDAEATRAWLDAFNARPIEERDSLLGPALTDLPPWERDELSSR